MDLADLVWPIPLFQKEKRHGLEMLARYRIARSSSSSGPPSEEVLAYIDELADALLEVGENGGNLPGVISNPALGLVFTKSGRRPTLSALRAAFGTFKPTGPCLPALRWRELIESGESPKKAMRIVVKEHPGNEPSAVRKAAKRYAGAIEYTLRERATERSWRERLRAEETHDLVVRDLIAECRAIDETTPRALLLVTPKLIHTKTGRLGWPKIEVTFPPKKKRLAKRLTKLDADDALVMFDMAQTCIAGEAECTLKESRAQFRAWHPESRYEFAIAALTHLRDGRAGQ